MPRFVKTILLCVALALALAPAAIADDAKTAELERKVKALELALADLRARSGDTPEVAELRRQIEVLTQEIENLKIGDAAPSVDATGGGKFGLAPGASKVYGVKRGVSIGGYGEMLYENFDNEREDGAPANRKDQVDFLRAIVYFGYKFNDRILFNSEIEFEHASTGKNGEVSVEFAYLDFLVRDAFNVRAGMVLVPMGFINELHEPPVFLGARRPYVEQQIIPTTWRENGAGIFGESGKVSYRAYLVTGLAAFADTASKATGFSATGIRDGRSSGSRSASEDFGFVGRVDFRPTGGLLVGASAYTGGSDQGTKTAGGAPIDATVTILEGHAEYRWRGLQARALYATTSIDDVAEINAVKNLTGNASVGEEQYGWYGEVGYDVLSGGDTRHALIPYLRYERYNTQDQVPDGFAANPANDVTVTTIGASWKPIPNVAVKLDWNQIENEARTGVDQINLAVGYLF
jgi:hypothetical protein